MRSVFCKKSTSTRAVKTLRERSAFVFHYTAARQCFSIALALRTVTGYEQRHQRERGGSFLGSARVRTVYQTVFRLFKTTRYVRICCADRVFPQCRRVLAADVAFFRTLCRTEALFPDLLNKLADPVDNAPTALGTQQALAKQLAMLLDFILEFDQRRMMRPHLSNDFSYYRRLLPKFNKHPKVE